MDRLHNVPGNRALGAIAPLAAAEREQMTQEPYLLDQISRATVPQALQKGVLHRGWNLLAAHVRTTHGHVVVQADARPEKVMNDFKSYATRGLDRRFLTRHPSLNGPVVEGREAACLR